MAAAAGGITTLIPYIGAFKAWGGKGDLREALDSFIEEGRNGSLLDFAIHLSLNQDDMPEIERTIHYAAERGVCSYKLFTAYKKRGMQVDDPNIIKVMEAVVKHGGLLAAHCENGAVIDRLEEIAIAEGQVQGRCFEATHPALSEAEALFRFMCLAKMIGCPIYLPHLSTKQSLEVVDLARSWPGPPIFAETCPHYLCLTDGIMEKWGTRAKVTPPIRQTGHAEPLWSALADGRIQVVGSDHAGHSSALKQPHYGNVFASPTGIPGGDMLLRLIYNDGVAQGRLTLPNLVRVLCENPARIFGLWPRKGGFNIGGDADLVIWNPETETVGQAVNPYLEAEYNLYEGWKLMGRADMVIRRGHVIFEDGELTAEGGGEYLPADLSHWPS
jgi:dihydropyrimidinase